MSTTTTTDSTTALRVAHVRYIDGDDCLRLQLRIHNDDKVFLRPVSEDWTKLHSRMELTAGAAATRGDKNKGPRGRTKARSKENALPPQEKPTRAAPPKETVRFLDASGSAIEAASLAISDVLLQTARIEIGATAYVVQHNEPTVVKLSALDPVLANIPIAPIAETEFCDPDDCKWQWWRLDVNDNETLCCSTRRFTPSTADIGCRFRIECRAPSLLDKGTSTDNDDANDDESSKASVVTTPVVNGPQRDVFAARQSLGRTRACASTQSSAFRVMSYNVLYQGYTSIGHTKQPLFPYVPADTMREMYRMQLVFQEIMESNADVVCLQEMGEAAFASFFAPVLAPLGYATFYAGKTGSTHEGCAVFVRLDAFEVESESVMDLAAAVKESDNATIQALLQTYADLAEGFDRTPSIAQLLVLRSTRHANQCVVVANTHLFYRGDADMIRLLQTLVIANNVSRLQQQAQAGNASEVGVVFCGDLNAFPNSAAVHLLLHGHIDSCHRQWQETPAFRWDSGATPAAAMLAGDNYVGEATHASESRTTQHSAHDSSSNVVDGRFEIDLGLANACGIPPFTTKTHTFMATLDYVLYSEATLRVVQVFPHFCVADVSVEVALPSSVFPSDHVSLVCDLAWR